MAAASSFHALLGGEMVRDGVTLALRAREKKIPFSFIRRGGIMQVSAIWSGFQNTGKEFYKAQESSVRSEPNPRESEASRPSPPQAGKAGHPAGLPVML
jgi:hypothetical protein